MSTARAHQAHHAMFGVGLRRPHFDDYLSDAPPAVDFVEIISENFMRFGGKPRAVLSRVKERYPIYAHGVSLSIGSPDALDLDYLNALKKMLDEIDAPFFSDHLCYASAYGAHYHDLLPLPFTEEAIAHVVGRIDEVQHRVGRVLALENPSYYMMLPGAEMDEQTFIREVVTRAGCKLLLDVNNVYVNATNHGYDARQFISALPLDRVVQIHMAGHDASGPFIVDTHGAPIVDPVFDLYRDTLAMLPHAVPTLLEWDNDIPSMTRLLEELSALRDIHAKGHA